MRRLVWILVILIQSGNIAAQQTTGDGPALIDSALALVGLSTADVKIDQDEMATWGGDRWRLNYFSLFHKHPFKLPRYGHLSFSTCSTFITNPPGLVAWAGRQIDYPVFRSFRGDPLETYLIYPDSVPKPSITRNKNILAGAQYDALKDGVDLIYALADDVNFLFRRGIKEIDKDKYRRQLFDYFINENEEHHDLVYELLDKMDFNRMIAGAQDIADAAWRVSEWLEPVEFPATRTEFKTRRGLIVIGGSGDDTFEYFTPPLLIIDGGGDDTYDFSGYPEKYPLSVIIDLAGDDRYLSHDSTLPGIGGAVIGMSVLIDKAGNDRYEAVDLSQGAGLFGVGVLFDTDGDDTYICKSLSQGAGAFGIGILADSSGHDSLYCLTMSQGFGCSKGIGLLVNFEGDDRYVAEDDRILAPSPQAAEHNTSLAQGVGFGKRLDYLDGHSWAGGVGILCDVKGNDHYSAGVFAQGCAYWFALGLFLEGGGNDSYRGAWYVQGAAAHFAVGYFDEFAGDDTYVAKQERALGAGHDFSIGYLNERGGNDVYSACNLSLGAGNANGIGVFQDHSGDDDYQTNGGITLGRAIFGAGGLRRYLRVFGIFADGGGHDTYREDFAGNGKSWDGPRSDDDAPADIEIGVGIDR